jgi:hypothetical protein
MKVYLSSLRKGAPPCCRSDRCGGPADAPQRPPQSCRPLKTADLVALDLRNPRQPPAPGCVAASFTGRLINILAVSADPFNGGISHAERDPNVIELCQQ